MFTGHIVQREVSSSIILFDAIAVIIWVSCLVYNKQKRALYFCAIGFVVYYLVDGVLWLAIMKTREISPRSHQYLLEIWLQLGPGIIHPSFVCMMLEGTFGPQRHTIRREFWILLFMLVQFTPAFMQKSIKGSFTIFVSRTMDSQRWLFILIALLSYLFLVYKNVTVKNMWKIFFICAGVETCFEFSLFLSDIRNASLKTILIDCVLEFNVGAALVLYLWRGMFPENERQSIDDVLTDATDDKLIYRCFFDTTTTRGRIVGPTP